MMNLIIRADASVRSGMGHVMRCLSLAEGWKEYGGRAVIVSCCDNSELRNRFESEGVEFIAVERPHPDPSDLANTLAVAQKIGGADRMSDTWVVLDGYHLDTGYQRRIKEAGFKLLCIDDYGHASHYYADIVLNQNISADSARYDAREPYTNLLLGPRFALLRSEFRRWKNWERGIPDVARALLVTMGGSDPDNVTLKIVRLLRQLRADVQKVVIVTGPAYPYSHQLLKEIESAGLGIRVMTSPESMPDLIAEADIAISSGGTTCTELAFMGLPFFVVVLAENQLLNAAAHQQNGTAFNLGAPASLARGMVKSVGNLALDRAQRRRMSQKGRNLVDGAGQERVIRAMVK